MTWDYRITAYAGARHPDVLAGRRAVGARLAETFHVGEESRDVALAAWKQRIRKREARAVEVITRTVLFADDDGN